MYALGEGNMTRLHADQTFHFELLRALGAARYGGSDVAEVLAIGGKLEAGDFAGWYKAFVSLANRVVASVETSKHPVAVRDGMFRAATYYRLADFFLHGNPEDPRILELWQKQRACFDRALPFMPYRAERVTLRADGFDIPAIFYRGSEDGAPRPTVIMCSGFDGSQEELLHSNAWATLERGYHVCTFEGPGQPSVRRDQNLGFIHDWERVVTPVVDYVLTRPEVAGDKITLLGMSMGGYLAARAAAFEHRLAAAILIDGVASMFPNFSVGLPPQALAMLEDPGQKAHLDALIAARPKPTDAKTRWAMEHSVWAFNTQSAWELLNKARKMTLEGLEGRVKCPVLVCDAARDHFFGDQPAQAAKILGDVATRYVFEDDELGAAEHCHEGARVEMNRVVYDWLERVLRKS